MNTKKITLKITTEPIASAEITPEIQNLINETWFWIDKSPKLGLQKALEAIQQYSHISEFYHLVAESYELIGDTDNTKKYIQEAYERFPNDIFSKCTYAHLALNQNDLEAIPTIFNNQFCLPTLYPTRTKFHITEAKTFDVFMARYFLKIHDYKQCKLRIELLEQYIPKDDPRIQHLRNEFIAQAPEEESWDFFQAWFKKIFEAEIGRNDLCSCGSNKKYKKCCLNTKNKGFL